MIHSFRRIAREVTAGLALLSWAAASAVAQPAGAITFEMPMQRTSVAGEPAETARIVSGSASIEHWFSQDRARVFYEVSLDRFQTADAWDTWLHNAGAVRSFAIGNANLDTGAALFWRANSGGWAEAGFRGVNVQSTLRQELTAGHVTASYNLYLRRFADAPALDQLEHYGSVRALANLQTRTTLVAAASIGWKRYDGDSVETIETAPSPSDPRGQGRRAMLLRSAAMVSPSGDATSRSLWTWSARVAQSIDDRTGVWVEREQRGTSGEAPPALVWTPPLFYDDGVYDDPYAIEARTWRAGARHVFARGDELAIWTSRSARDFIGLGVLDGGGGVVGERSDTLDRSGVDAAIVLRSTSLFDLMLLGGYGYVRNISNDAAETYRSHLGSLGLSLRW